MEIAVLGAGSWGTTIAVHLSDKGENVRLWDCDTGQLAAMEDLGENRKYLPGVRIPDTAVITASLEEAVGGGGCLRDSRAFGRRQRGRA